jgi:hypothetical protein
VNSPLQALGQVDVAQTVVWCACAYNYGLYSANESTVEAEQDAQLLYANAPLLDCVLEGWEETDFGKSMLQAFDKLKRNKSS